MQCVGSFPEEVTVNPRGAQGGKGKWTRHKRGRKSIQGRGDACAKERGRREAHGEEAARGGAEEAGGAGSRSRRPSGDGQSRRASAGVTQLDLPFERPLGSGGRNQKKAAGFDPDLNQQQGLCSGGVRVDHLP